MCRVIFGIYFSDNLLNDTVFINNKCSAHRAHIRFAIHGFFGPHTVGFYDMVLGIGQQRKRKMIFFGKFFVRLFTVYAHAQYGIAFGEHGVVAIAQAARLRRTAGSIIFGIKIEDNFLSLKIRQFNVVSVLILCFEWGRFFSYLQCHVFYG